MRFPLAAVSLALLVPAASSAADWPMQRADAARSGYVSDVLPQDLKLLWKRTSAHPPQRAWPRSKRQLFDACYEPVICAGRLFYGSSVDCSLRCLDAATGVERWSFFTGGPIRLAPVAWGERVAVASDDGRLYVLDAQTGDLVWQHRGGPQSLWRLGNQRMISKWPARGGPVLLDGVLYYAVGIWPSDGIYIYALNAQTGDELWSNKDSGGIYMPQPHGGANAASGLAAQGHLAARGKRVFVPTGRAIPAALDRDDGKLAYFFLQKNRGAGGTSVVLAGRYMINSGILFDAASGEARAKLNAHLVAAFPEGLVTADTKGVHALRMAEVEKPDRKGKPVKALSLQPRWSVPDLAGAVNLIAAGEAVIVGGSQRVTILDGTPGKEKRDRRRWSTEVEGSPYGLAVADGRLYVSTDRGVLYCFAERLAGEAREHVAANRTLPAADPAVASVVDELIAKTGIREGYCLDLGCGDGALALELARRTNLTIFAVDDDPARVQRTRRRLTAAGLYGVRVTVHHAPLDATGYPKYFANLVISSHSLRGGADAVSAAEVLRLQRPFGGVACLGEPGQMRVTRRGALAGAGSWTHQYSNPANTVSSEDALVSGSLGILWFRDVGQELPQRHGRGPAPLFHRGRLFHEGLDEIRAVDAYNGRELWSYQLSGVLKAYDGDHLMGTSGTGSNYCVSAEGVFARHRDFCVRIDPANGQPLGEYRIPPVGDAPVSEEAWGYIACVDGRLFGSRADPDHVVTYRYQAGGDMRKQLTESNLFFVYDVASEKLLWQYQPEYSIRHNAIAIGAQYVYLIDRPQAVADRVKRETDAPAQPGGTLVALDKQTGKVAWRRKESIYGTTLAVSDKHSVLMMSYQNTSFKLASELGGRLTAFDAITGETKWDREAHYQSRLTLMDRTVIADGGAWDLLTGDPRKLNFKRSYGCGVLSGGKDMLFFRSATLGYFDLAKNDKVRNFGGVRPGCWINAIPAGGLVLVPDASAGCSCSYLNRSWFALEPMD